MNNKLIKIKIDNIKIKVKPNITILQACNLLNKKINIPVFCFHNNLNLSGNCRMCFVEVKSMPKPVISCVIPVIENMEIFTKTTLVKKSRELTLEFILKNHPLDCPICDQGGECDLQDISEIYGSDRSRNTINKITVSDINWNNPLIKTIMTRCIKCSRCIRFFEIIDYNYSVGIIGRGKKCKVSFYKKNKKNSLFSANVVDLCPVGALTENKHSFKYRSWDLEIKTIFNILNNFFKKINISIYNNKIIRILPTSDLTYFDKIYIPDNFRLFYKNLDKFKLTNILIKKKNKFEKTNINIIKKNILYLFYIKNLFKFNIIIGNYLSLNSLKNFKYILNKIGIRDNINYESSYFINNTLNTNLINNFILKKKNLETSNLFLFLNYNIFYKNKSLYLNLDNNKQDSYYIGNYYYKENFKYIKKLFKTNTTTLSIILVMVLGKSIFCQKILKSKKFILFLNNFILKKENILLLSLFLKKFKYINIEQIDTTFINFFDIFSSKKILKKNSIKENIFYYNTSKIFYPKNKYNIYIGHNKCKNFYNSNIVIPISNFIETGGEFINLLGIKYFLDKIIERNKNNYNNNIFKYILNLKKKNKFKKKNKKNKFNNYLIYFFEKNNIHIN